MTDIKTMAICCDQDVIISNRDILRGIMHRTETQDKVLIGCPYCHTALVMDEDMPQDTPLFEKWVVDNQKDPDWIPCLPFLDDRILAEPQGTIVIGKKTKYKAGSGELLGRYEYMVKYGVDPEGAIRDNPALGGQPFKVTGSKRHG